MIHLDINAKIGKLVVARLNAVNNDIEIANGENKDATDLISEKFFLEELAGLLEIQL